MKNNSITPFQRKTGLGLLAMVCTTLPLMAAATTYPITTQQRTVANQVAQQGVPLKDVRPDAPQRYVVVRGDTLWAISKLYLNSPWRWPELWGMNLDQIRNPHLIYPGQTLNLVVKDGRAWLELQSAQGASNLPVERLSPRTRIKALPDNALPTLNNALIEPFLTEPLIVQEGVLDAAPRIVAAQDDRVMLTKGDRAYARSTSGQDLLDDPQQKQKVFRIFRNAIALKDPGTGVILGYEAQYIGRALLARSEGTQQRTLADGKVVTEIVPATLDITMAKEEIRAGDRLLPEPPTQMQHYVPHAQAGELEAQVVSVYGSSVVHAAQNQVVVINKGLNDGLRAGRVLAILSDGARLKDKTDPERADMKLPDERNGLLMVFRPFDKLSYGLVLEITRGVKIGDRLRNPR
jgi:hypothetical protein